MRFIDEVRIHVRSGTGGDGCSAFRREAYVPFGGPNGGDGGRGGDVILVATKNRNTLLDLRRRPVWEAESGNHGKGSQRTGACGDALRILVPVGTRLVNHDTGEVLGDLTTEGMEQIVAVGGRGGLGNVHFKSSRDRAPTRRTLGGEAEEVHLRLELMLMADVGLLGFPNAGKSTLVSRMSAARPKVADYPFTTLVPSLGVVRVGLDASFVMADIPGLIRGASEGAGLGHRFLRHVSRTRLLVHLVSLDSEESESPAARYAAIREELAAYDSKLASRPEILVLTKSDLADDEAVADIVAELGLDTPPLLISAVTGAGLPALQKEIWTRLTELRIETDGEPEPAPVLVPPHKMNLEPSVELDAE